MKILVDTNVLLDLFLDREVQADSAEAFVKRCRSQKHQIYLTTMQMRDIEYFAHRHFHNKEKSQKTVETVYSLVTKLLPLSADSAINSIYSDYSDFEDQLLAKTAEEFLLDCIVTNNIKDFEKNNCEVLLYTPQSFLELTENN